MKIQTLLLIICSLFLSACTSTSSTRSSKPPMTASQKSWANYQTKQRGYGVYYPGYANAPKKNTKPSWANRPYNKPSKTVKPSWAK